jgi:hypothetical protein
VQPKKLKTLAEFNCSFQFDPTTDELSMLGGTSKITVWEPWFLMSGVGMLTRKVSENVGSFKGSGFTESDPDFDNQPSMTLILEEGNS